MKDRAMPPSQERITVTIDSELAEIVPGYLENRRKDVITIRQALAQSEWETIRTLGHRMKGSGAGYGFAAITEIGRGLEVAAKECNAANITQGVDALEAYVQCVQVVFQD